MALEPMKMRSPGRCASGMLAAARMNQATPRAAPHQITGKNPP